VESGEKGPVTAQAFTEPWSKSAIMIMITITIMNKNRFNCHTHNHNRNRNLPALHLNEATAYSLLPPEYGTLSARGRARRTKVVPVGVGGGTVAAPSRQTSHLRLRDGFP
jgi:hypothetical protein